MDSELGMLTAALWLGIQTAISPCPLATNIAAISYIGRRVDRPRDVFLGGLLYTLGRTVTYTVLGMVLVGTFLAIQDETSFEVSRFVKDNTNKAVGPVLILIGMLLLNLISLNVGGGGISERMQQRVDSMGIWGAGLLGVLFALAFCPVSAGFFFSSLIPAVKADSPIILLSIYGVGTALPVIAFAAIIAVSAKSVGTVFNRLSQIEWWSRRITGTIILLIGIVLSLQFCFGIDIQGYFLPLAQ